MTKRSTKAHDESRRLAAVHVASAGNMVHDFVRAVDRSFRQCGLKPPSPRTPHTTQAIDITLAECEGVLEGAADQAGFDRAMFPSRVVRTMVVVERAKIHKDARGWITRHFGDELQPARPARSARSEASA
jgi:hypothetical protein